MKIELSERYGIRPFELSQYINNNTDHESIVIRGCNTYIDGQKLQYCSVAQRKEFYRIVDKFEQVSSKEIAIIYKQIKKRHSW